MKKILLIFCGMFFSCCSYQFVNPYNKFEKDSCTSNYVAPVFDTAMTALVGVPALWLTGLLLSDPKTDGYFGALPHVITGGSLFITYKFGSSMKYGYKEVSKCRKFNL